jgi:hypothetical protein
MSDTDGDRPFATVRGVKVPDLTGIRECYAVAPTGAGHHAFTINAGADRLDLLFRELVACVPEPGFLVLQCATREDEERKLRAAATDPFHQDVLFLDRLTRADLLAIYDRYSEILIHDGLIHYGYGSHAGVDEVYVGDYKVVSVLTFDPARYEAVLAHLGWPRADRVRTVWDNISPAAPGARHLVRMGDRDIFGMIEELRSRGLYMSGRRPG